MNRSSVALLAFCTLSASAGEPAAGRNGLLEIARVGSQPAAKGGPDNFKGDVSVEARFQQTDPARVGGATVTFQPGARTAWHTHPLGQTLIITSGVGWVQSEGGAKQTMRAGDVVLIPPRVKHWHGASADSAMTHVAVAESLNGSVVSWKEHVTDAQYRAESATAGKESVR